ncbi:methyl-accepting chemotaxis protein [Paraburkholderia kururiensis]|uniref:Methyl-accepting chemotaxis protein n=1 Tax=Paraburkholderia kururiensis TaxID=984307 RepID=A0ABZ0WP73_9BURK|nr:methyl-accepting chemotaxis protein [Paraburkholderia kururiensis]WQD79060.1 methyl-accepting chemotaxis protein [Paraburkholderia kururiensis]
MKLLNNLGIGARLTMGFGILLALLLAMGGVASLQVSNVYRGTQALAEDWLPSVQTLGDIRAAANGVRRATLRSLLESEAAHKNAQRQAHDEQLTLLRTELVQYEKMVSSPEEQRLFEAIKQSLADYLTMDDTLLQLSDQGAAGFDRARTLATKDSAAAFTKLADFIGQDVALNQKGAQEAATSAGASYRQSLAATGIVIACAVALGIACAALISRSITRPIRQAVGVAEAVAAGNLTSEIDVYGRDEIARLLTAMSHMNDKLNEIVTQVRSGSENVATGAAQIASGNADLSQRTEEQAASLEETAATMEEITATIRRNTESAQQGNAVAREASEVAARGGDLVGKVVSAMQDISSSSDRVANIISVIEGVAFQTNILALNAAVEAARAGEQGRGFAVVASEVRTLAQRSASASREIKQLIEASVQTVDAGKSLVDAAGQTMTDVVQSVRRVNDIMAEISAASEEQSRGVEQINQAITQMDEVTQQNAALVEEAAAASRSLEEQSLQLKDSVSVFRVKSQSGNQHVRPTGRAAPSVVRGGGKLAVSASLAQRLPAPAHSAEWEKF